MCYVLLNDKFLQLRSTRKKSTWINLLTIDIQNKNSFSSSDNSKKKKQTKKST